MKKALLLLAVVVFLTSLMNGCSADGVVDTYGERMLRYRQINEWQARMFVDDWDYFWLYERDSNLSQWNPRVGY